MSGQAEAVLVCLVLLLALHAAWRPRPDFGAGARICYDGVEMALIAAIACRIPDYPGLPMGSYPAIVYGLDLFRRRIPMFGVLYRQVISFFRLDLSDLPHGVLLCAPPSLLSLAGLRVLRWRSRGSGPSSRHRELCCYHPYPDSRSSRYLEVSILRIVSGRAEAVDAANLDQSETDDRCEGRKSYLSLSPFYLALFGRYRGRSDGGYNIEDFG